MKNQLTLIATLGALVGVGCGPSQAEFDAERARAAELEGQLNEARETNARLSDVEAQNAELGRRLSALGADLSSVEGDREALQARLDQTRQALEELQAREQQAQARLATFRNMLERFRSMIEAGQLRVRIQRGRMVVELPEGVLFDSGKDRLKKEGQSTLAEVAKVLSGIEGRQFQICGHTDNVPISGRFKSNWELAASRAVHVAKFLVDQGMDAARLSAAGYADTQPVADNESAEGRAQNRRIEIALVPNLEELPDLSALEGLSSGASEGASDAP